MKGADKMIILPPDEIIDYVECNEEGKWVCTKDMPEEYLPIFEKFVNDAEYAVENKLEIFNEARREFE